jgi:hypothetical protein
MSVMIEALKRAFERASQEPEEEQAALAALIMQTLEDDARWDALFADPISALALEKLAAEAIAEDEAGETEEITGDGFLS